MVDTEVHGDGFPAALRDFCILTSKTAPLYARWSIQDMVTVLTEVTLGGSANQTLICAQYFEIFPRRGVISVF